MDKYSIFHYKLTNYAIEFFNCLFINYCFYKADDKIILFYQLSEKAKSIKLSEIGMTIESFLEFALDIHSVKIDTHCFIGSNVNFQTELKLILNSW